MKKTWQTIEAWLAAEFPAGLENLGRPADDSEIRTIESALADRLPGELRELLAIHNGEQPDEIWLLGNWSLLPIQYIGKAWREQLEMSVQQDCDLVPDEYVKPGLWNRRWYPFAYDGSGGFLCLDMDPTASGRAGQIIATNSDGFSHRVADSMTALFDRFAHALLDGQLEVIDDCLEADGEWWS